MNNSKLEEADEMWLNRPPDISGPHENIGMALLFIIIFIICIVASYFQQFVK